MVAGVADGGQQVGPDVGGVTGANVGRAHGEAEVGPAAADGLVVAHHGDAVVGIPARLVGVVGHDLVVVLPDVNARVDQIAVYPRLVVADEDGALDVEAVGGDLGRATAAILIRLPVGQVQPVFALVELADDEGAGWYLGAGPQAGGVELEDTRAGLYPMWQAGRADEVGAEFAGHDRTSDSC